MPFDPTQAEWVFVDDDAKHGSDFGFVQGKLYRQYMQRNFTGELIRHLITTPEVHRLQEVMPDGKVVEVLHDLVKFSGNDIPQRRFTGTTPGQYTEWTGVGSLQDVIPIGTASDGWFYYIAYIGYADAAGASLLGVTGNMPVAWIRRAKPPCSYANTENRLLQTTFDPATATVTGGVVGRMSPQLSPITGTAFIPWITDIQNGARSVRIADSIREVDLVNNVETARSPIYTATSPPGFNCTIVGTGMDAAGIIYWAEVLRENFGDSAFSRLRRFDPTGPGANTVLATYPDILLEGYCCDPEGNHYFIEGTFISSTYTIHCAKASVPGTLVEVDTQARGNEFMTAQPLRFCGWRGPVGVQSPIIAVFNQGHIEDLNTPDPSPPALPALFNPYRSIFTFTVQTPATAKYVPKTPPGGLLAYYSSNAGSRFYGPGISPPNDDVGIGSGAAGTIRAIPVAFMGPNYLLFASTGTNYSIGEGGRVATAFPAQTNGPCSLWLMDRNNPNRIVHQVVADSYVDPLAVVYCPIDGRVYWAQNFITPNGAFDPPTLQERQTFRLSCASIITRVHWYFGTFGSPTVSGPFSRGINFTRQVYTNPNQFSGGFPWADLTVHPQTGEVWYTQNTAGVTTIRSYDPDLDFHAFQHEFRNRTFDVNTRDYNYDLITGIEFDSSGGLYLMCSNFKSTNANVNLTPAESELHFIDPDDGGMVATSAILPFYCYRLKLDQPRVIGNISTPQFRTYLFDDAGRVMNPAGINEGPADFLLYSTNIRADLDLPDPTPPIGNLIRKKRGKVAFRFTIRHPTSDPADIEVGYSIEDETDPKVGFIPATLAEPYNIIKGVKTSPTGLTHIVVWDSVRDVEFNAFDTGRLRIRPLGGPFRATPIFILNNSLDEIPSNEFEDSLDDLIQVKKVLPVRINVFEKIPVLVIKGEGFDEFSIINVQLRGGDNIPTMTFGQSRFKIVDTETINIENIRFTSEALFDVFLLNRFNEVVAVGIGLMRTV